MKMIGGIHCRKGFSILEILIALGLFIVGLIAILAFFPVALRSENEGIEDARATLIASGVMDSITSDQGDGIIHLATGMSNGVPVFESIPLIKNTNFIVAYTASCEPLRKLTEEESAAPVPNPEAVAVVTISLASKPSIPRLFTADVAVASPAAAPESGRTIRRFARQIIIP
jgi:type II secretory pathway pseudopilin PulG